MLKKTNQSDLLAVKNPTVHHLTWFPCDMLVLQNFLAS